MSQSGILRLKLAFGKSSARSAFSRNRAPKKPVCSSLFRRKVSTFSGVRSEKRSWARNSQGSISRMASSFAMNCSGFRSFSSQACCQGKGKRPVHPAAPEGVQDHLLEVSASAGLFHMLDQKMMPVRERAARRFFLQFQKPDELICSRVLP